MFTEQFNAAIEAASLSGLDGLSKSLWQSHSAGSIADSEAQQLAELIEARRQLVRPISKSPTARSPGGHRPVIFPPRRVQRSPDRARSIERRRTLAASGVMPASMAARLTTGELAVLKIVADAVRANGQCVLPIDAIAARAGVCRRLAQNAIREAALLGWLTVQERRRQGRRNDFNVVRIICREWLAWIARGIGCKKNHPTDTQDRLPRKKGAPAYRQSTASRTNRCEIRIKPGTQ